MRLQQKAPMETARRRRWLISALIVCSTLLIAGVASSRTTVGRAVVRSYLPSLVRVAVTPVETVDAPWPESVFNCEPTTIDWVEPGTIIDGEPPGDWSHLVLKNDTRVVAGERSKRSERWNQLAEMFSMALLADVDRQGNNYILARVGTGWCLSIDGHETVISSSTRAKLGAPLSALAVLALRARENECEEETRIIARSASTLFYDVERTLVFEERHLTGHLRYALLAHPRTGDLAAFLWIVPPEEIEPAIAARIERLPPNFKTTFGLRFRRSSGGLLAMPRPDDYAVVDIPTGESQVPITASLRPVAYAPQLNQAQALELERVLRGELGWR